MTATAVVPELLDTPVSDIELLTPLSPARRRFDAELSPLTPGLSLRSNFAWMLSGNVVYALCQWGAIVALAKLGSTLMVGQFSLGLAIATPVLMLTNLQLRAVQATDARRSYSFSEYLRLRTALTLLGLTVIASVAFLGHYGRQTAFVIVAAGGAKGIETLSDIHYGLFQLNDRLDQTGKSMMLRGALAMLALSAGLSLTNSVFWACTGMSLVWLAVLLLFDMRHGRHLTAAAQESNQPAGLRRPLVLMRTALPLGLATTLAALNLNMPRYFIQGHLGERQLGIYSALAWSAVGMVLVSDSIGHSAIPRLSRMYTAGQDSEFRSLILRLVAVSAGLGIAGLAVASFFGERLLALIYGTEYAAQYHVFRLLILATGIYCVACMFTSAVTAARCFRIQVPIYALIVATNALACAVWVPSAGLAGGAAALLAAATVHLLLGATVFFTLLWRPVRTAIIDVQP